MPYEGERANKASHFDIVDNPDVEQFLGSCSYVKEPSKDELSYIISKFMPAVGMDSAEVPEYLIATDGSFYESSINQKFPNTRVGYLKFGTMLIKLTEFKQLNFEDTDLVDPFKVAALEDQNKPVTLTLPSSNVMIKGSDSVKESFRLTLDKWFYDHRTKIDEEDGDTSLANTLFDLASIRPDIMGSQDKRVIRVHRCPTCGFSPDQRYFEVRFGESTNCKKCNRKILATDVLRVWEEVSEYNSNIAAISRIMNLTEHLFVVHFIRYLLRVNPDLIDHMVFFVDGPLAVFGNCAWLHRSIMHFLAGVREQIGKIPLIIGIQKTGQVHDFAMSIEHLVDTNHIFPVDDAFRYKYILSGRPAAENGFGDETYYGQDFLYKTKSGKLFIFALPYPFSGKREDGEFHQRKTSLALYPDLPRAMKVICEFESDLYRNAIIPITLAHKYTSISLQPGGRILDLLTERGLKIQK